jgi:hypothetical protein
MKPQHVHQEVLIFTTTSLTKRSLYKKNSSKKDSSAIEELEEAFWDGLLSELAPEIMASAPDIKMVIWAVYAGEFYLRIDLAEGPVNPESRFTIDPNLLLSSMNMN